MVERKDMKKIGKQAEENKKAQKRIANEWKTFSKTLAYKDLMEYMTTNQDMLLDYAEEMVMPSPVKNGEQILLTIEKAHSLLQNRRGIGIVKSYVDTYANITTL